MKTKTAVIALLAVFILALTLNLAYAGSNIKSATVKTQQGIVNNFKG